MQKASVETHLFEGIVTASVFQSHLCFFHSELSETVYYGRSFEITDFECGLNLSFCHKKGFGKHGFLLEKIGL